jgi:hypothetical protein
MSIVSTRRSLAELKEEAEILFKSGFCQDCKTVEQVLYKLMWGNELGVGSIASVQGIYIQENAEKDKQGNTIGKIRKPALTAPFMATVIKMNSALSIRTKTFDHKVSEIEIRDGDEVVRVSTFSVEDAQKANIMRGFTWNQYTRNMLHHRNISNIAKTDCCDAFGGAPVYTPEELGMEVDGEGIPITDEREFLDNRTYVDEELAERGEPSVAEKKAAAKAEKEAAKKAAAATKPEAPAAPKPTATQPAPSTPITTADTAAATPSATPPAAPGAGSEPQTDRPGDAQMAELLQLGLAKGKDKGAVNGLLIAYLRENNTTKGAPLGSFKEYWTWDDFQNLKSLVVA